MYDLTSTHNEIYNIIHNVYFFIYLFYYYIKPERSKLYYNIILLSSIIFLELRV